MKEPSIDRPIYLDHNATTPLDPRVADRMARCLAEEFGNPSSGHPWGRRAAELVEGARAEVAEILGAGPAEICFTSGATESINLALKGLALARETAGRGRGGIITCLGEHPAVLESCAWLEGLGFSITRLPIDGTGRVDPADLERAVTPDTFLISIMQANNETGTVQPIGEVGRIARERDIFFHSDAAQSVGKIPVSVKDLGVDLLSVAGHKFGAPKGVGALYLRRRAAPLDLVPLLHGGGQEHGLRSGTEAVHQAAGLGAACRHGGAELKAAGERMRALRDRLHRLLEQGVEDLTLNGHPTERLPGTLNVNFPRVTGAELLAQAKGVAASTGSACHGREVTLSPVLNAMGVPTEIGRGAVRLSLGKSTTREEVERAAEILIQTWRKLSR